MEILILIGALVIILLGAEAFTNSLEHFGQRLGISEGVTGSIFAAIGTALPETMVPLFAIFLGSGTETLRHEVAVGAILGAPLLLATLAFFSGRDLCCAIKRVAGDVECRTHGFCT